MRGGLAIVDARHLAGQFLEVGSRVACDKDLGLVAMPGQRDIARRRSPVFGMIEIGLVERAALAFVDRAGIAVPELFELLGVERDLLTGAAVQLHVNDRVLDLGDRAGMAIEEPALLGGADDLDAVAGCIGLLPAPGREFAVLSQLAAFAAHAPDRGIDLVHVVIGVGEDEAGF